MDKERMINHQTKRKKAINRSEAFKTHLEHTEDGRSRIAKIIGCDRSEVDELFQLIKWKKLILLAMMIGLLVGGCATIPVKTYEETVAGWTSYKDVEKWMSENFVYDQSRLAELIRNHGGSIYPSRLVFKLKGGVCQDGARFIKETLDLINPAYEAQIVFIDNSDVVHYVCSFKKDGKLYIMDYATVHRDMIGTHGPFNSLGEYKEFYGSHHAGCRSISYGWPPHMKGRLEK